MHVPTKYGNCRVPFPHASRRAVLCHVDRLCSLCVLSAPAAAAAAAAAVVVDVESCELFSAGGCCCCFCFCFCCCCCCCLSCFFCDYSTVVFRLMRWQWVLLLRRAFARRPPETIPDGRGRLYNCERGPPLPFRLEHALVLGSTGDPTRSSSST